VATLVAHVIRELTMSYILDALKKSDLDRLRNATPALATVHSEFHARRGARIGQPWSTLLVLTLGAGAASGVWWALGHPVPYTASAPAVETPSVVPAAAPGAGVATGQEEAMDPVAAAVALASHPDPVLSEEESFPPAEELPELLEIWQLTEAEQRYLQELEVTLHIHSPDPAQRTVIINGLRAREGQPLGQDLQLEEITADGLIFRFQGRRVHLATVGQ
jgi:hypothetical protein